MNTLPQKNKSSQTSFTVHRFNPATGTNKVISIENRSGFKHLRKPELTDEDRKTIQEMRERGKNLDPETLKSIINRFIEDKLKGWTPGWEGRRAESQGDVRISEPESGPEKKGKGRDLVPGKKAKVTKLPKYPRTPLEVMRYCRALYGHGEWKRILRGVHKFCLYRKRKEDKYYPGKSERKNRQYVYGQVWLAKEIDLSRKTVEKWLQRFEEDGVIYYPYIGYVGRGASVMELAYTVGHMKVNKREIRKRKKRPSIR